MIVPVAHFSTSDKERPFIITVDVAASEVVEIPTSSQSYTYDYDIDWGDGNVSVGQTGDASHTYLSAGTFDISISGVFPHIYISWGSMGSQIREIKQWGTQVWKSFDYSFAGCQDLTVTAVDTPYFGDITTMYGMFSGTSNLSGNFDYWDLSSVTFIEEFFDYSNFNEPIENWILPASGAQWGLVFTNCSVFNQPLNGWNTSGFVALNSFFQNCTSFNQPLNNWDVSNVTTMSNLFQGTAFNQDISGWDVSNVNSMSGLFRSSAFNQDISGWDVSSVTNMTLMFYQNTVFNQDLSGWCVSNIPTAPYNFDAGATNWILPKPVWGTCP